MRMALFVWVVWISTTHTTWGQRVTGSIKNTAGEGISAYIELKNSRNGSTIDFFNLRTTVLFTLRLPQTQHKRRFICSSEQWAILHFKIVWL